MPGTAPTEGMAFLARAQARAALHRFQDALNDLDMAESLDQRPAPAVVAAERAAIFQATGHYQQALRLRQEAVDHHADFETLGALAGVHAELGQIDTAAALFDRGATPLPWRVPFPLALLDFQCGHMWQRHGDLERAHKLFAAACRLVPQYVPAQGHLAEVETALGQVEAAIERLRRLVGTSDDPEYAGQLAGLLGEAESHAWRSMASARYDELILRHPAAFADHAARFWLRNNADPHKARRLARINLDVRQTPHAYELLARTQAACDAMRPRQ